MAIYCKYGSTFLSPVPLININKTFHKSADHTPIGALYNVTLNGTVVSYPSGGLINVHNKQNELIDAFKDEGQIFHIYCSGISGAQTDIIKSAPRINSIQFDESSNNWVFTSPYTIELEFDELSFSESTYDSSRDPDWVALNPPSSIFISEATEDWQLEFYDTSPFSLTLPTVGADQNSIPLRLTHTVSAVGKRYFNASGLEKQAWERAKDYVIFRIGYDSTQIAASSIFNLNTSGYIPYNHVRSQTIDELGGSFSISESWLVSNTGAGIIPHGIESFTATIKKDVQSDITTVEINGEIEGLETRTYGASPGDFNITTNKYAAASGYFSIVQNRFYDRCKHIAGSTPRRVLNINPLSEVVAHSPSRGIVSYTYEFNDRPYNIISGAISESITITDDAPTDVFASLIVPGRSAGPILQDIGTVTARVRNINIEVVVPPYTGGVNNTTDVTALFAATPETAVNTFLSYFVVHLSGLFGQVFLTSDRPSWQPKLGIYSRDVSYTLGNCG